ncbi:putative caffeine-induced death protein Cid2 [Talaromyces proteolyticus]|uniref:Caffeine-induced death protein Cid2 n=1 Tax=Talaromyces proteolyticus TaxID=1131652 RepID=A0AAD4KVC0_9EURO|nr:putative caffeine-induced death protein Cid2 [Talaromyces proteolyticus]KAH8697551.1 putative caffeine-induced death protein Cid2 [Talaromyces proteolyticus]
MSKPLPVDSTSLTPQFCFNERVLRDFLRLSRTTIDDSITQNLNALLKPAGEGFDPSSTHVRQLDATSKRKLSNKACDSFKDDVLFPAWQTRSDILNFCAAVATSPDPEDPDLISRQVESAKEHERVVNERLDPYSSRYFPREARTESLASLVRNERSVEQIIRARTWGVVAERCGTTRSWEDALDLWQEQRRIKSDSS